MLLLEKKTYSLSQNSHTWIRLFPTQFFNGWKSPWFPSIFWGKSWELPGNNSMVKTLILKGEFEGRGGFTADLQFTPSWSRFSRNIGRRTTRFTWTNNTGEETFDIDECLWLWGQWATPWTNFWSDDVHLEGDLDFPPRSLKVYLALSLPLFVPWSQTDRGLPLCLWTLTCHQDFAEGVPRVQH